MATLEEMVAGLRVAQEQSAAKLVVLHGALAQDLSLAAAAVKQPAPKSKVHILESTPFNGARCSKELENFWDIKQMFGASHVPEAEKVAVRSTYLAEDAKLWWWTKAVASTKETTMGWEEFKGELRDNSSPGTLSSKRGLRCKIFVTSSQLGSTCAPT